MSYKADIPHWGKASIHPHIHHPGEMFLDCPELGIRMHPLGRVFALDAITPAEQMLMKTLEQRGIWCLEALAAIGVALADHIIVADNDYISFRDSHLLR